MRSDTWTGYATWKIIIIFIVRKHIKYLINSWLKTVYWAINPKVRENSINDSSSDSENLNFEPSTFVGDFSKRIFTVFQLAVYWDITNYEEVLEEQLLFSPIDDRCHPSANYREDLKFLPLIVDSTSNCVSGICKTYRNNFEQNRNNLSANRDREPTACQAMPSLPKNVVKPPFFKWLILVGIVGVFFTKTITYIFIYPGFRLVFGTLYPAYASYKAVKTKNVKEYVKWMMYWIVFALFTCTETFTDIFLSWFPFYYEIKIILVIWLLSPATKGSSILYRKFVHPMLSSREQEIDDYILKAKEQSYRQVLDLGQKGVTVLMQTAIKSGGGIVNQLKKSYSLSDLSDPTNDGSDEADDVLVTDPRLIRRRKPGRSPHRSSSTSSASVYFSEVDVLATGVIGGGRVTEIRSIEDISSGYSSGEGLYASHQPLKLQARDTISSQRTNSLTRSRSTRVTRSTVPKKSSLASDDSDENEVFDTNIIFLNDKAKKIDKLPEKHESSSSEAEFYDIPENIGFELHGKIFKNSERSNSNNKEFHNNKINSSKLEVVKYNQIDSLTDENSHTPAIIGSKITACKNDVSPPSSSISINLTKLSAALSSLYPSFSYSSKFNETEKASNVKSINLESNYQKPDMSKASVNLDSKSLLFATNDGIGVIEPHLSKKVCNMQVTHPSTDQPTCQPSTFKTNNLYVAPNLDTRGGRYNKKHAPLPPLPPNRNNLSANPIKATLVLQPGVVRSLSASAESLNKEIFLNYSPKTKRKCRNQSPASGSSKSSDSSTSPKGENALSRMLRLPKKMTHLNVHGKIKEKRNSWGDFFHTKKLVDSRIQSKSASNLDDIAEAEKVEADKLIQRRGSQICIKSLTDSPLAPRRLKVIRRNVDNDSVI